MVRQYDHQLKGPLRKLRKQMTEAEQLLWSRLRTKQLLGVQFNRQKPMVPYVVDFYSAAALLVITGCLHNCGPDAVSSYRVVNCGGSTFHEIPSCGSRGAIGALALECGGVMQESGFSDHSGSRILTEDIFDTVREPMLVLEHELKVTKASASFYRHFEVSAEETIGKFIYDLGNRQWDIPVLRKLLEEVIPQKQTFDNYEVRHHFDKIGLRTLLLNARRIDTSGLILLAMEDITDRRNAEEGLRHSEERFRRLFETSKDGILILDADDGVILDANPFMEQILNLKRSDFKKRHLWELGAFKDIASSRSAFAKLQASGFIRFEDLPLVTTDGKEINVEFICNRYVEERRSVIQCNVRDITDRKELERQRKLAQEQIEDLNLQLAAHAAILEDKNRELEAFNYSVAHDLRQPLNTIGLYCQTILKQYGERLDADAAGSLTKIQKLTAKMDGLIEALLRFSRLGQVELRRERVNLTKTAHESAEALRQAFPQRKVSFRIADELIVDGDAKLLSIMIDNLFANAWKFTSMREEAVIEFGIEEADGEPAYFIRDNGIGLADADLESLFIPFRRSPGAEAFKGYGIGLATVGRIVQRHGGRIWAERQPEQGATFRFTLPQPQAGKESS